MHSYIKIVKKLTKNAPNPPQFLTPPNPHSSPLNYLLNPPLPIAYKF